MSKTRIGCEKEQTDYLLTVAVVHDDAEFASFGLKHFNEGHDVGVTEGFQKTRLL